MTCLVLGTVGLASRPARTDEPPREEPAASESPEETPLPRHRITYGNVFGVMYNPLGLEDRIDLRYRLRLYDDPGVLFRDAHVGVGFTPSINPALTQIGATIVVKPLAVVTLKAQYAYYLWYGNFGYLQSFPSARADHSDTALERRRDDEENYATTGHELQLTAELIAKVGPIVISDDINAHWEAQDLREGDVSFYSIHYDVMVGNRGWILRNDASLLYLTDFGFIGGVTSSLVHSFYNAEHFAPGEPGANINTPTVSLGPLLAYVFYDKPERLFNRPTLLFIAAWWLKHRFRTGQDVPQALPNLILALTFEGEIWGSQ